MEKVLFACDELTGLIGAAVRMRPSKSVQDLEVSSLKKKFKDKKFAAGCSRDVIRQGAELLGWERCTLYDRPGVRSTSGTVFLFIEEADYIPPVWPEENGRQQKQMHFDFQVDDVAAAVGKAEALGAVKTEAQFGGNLFVTMLDPAGHPFCLCKKEHA